MTRRKDEPASANALRAAAAVEADRQLAAGLMAEPPDWLVARPEWLAVVRERAAGRSWREAARVLGESKASCYGRWRRVQHVTGVKPRPSRALPPTEPLPEIVPEPLADWTHERHPQYSLAYGTARPPEAA